MQPLSAHKKSAAALLVPLVLALLPLQAHAGLLDSVTALLSTYITREDESMSMLRMVFGEFIMNPFTETAATSGNLLGDMFKSYNMFIFTVAMIWFAYNAMAGLAQTMHEGVVLGRRMSTVWVPLRFTFGAASLMPVFGGWAFCQALMVVSATLGIAGANAISSTAIASASNFNVLVNPMGSVKQPVNLVNVEQTILRGVACMRANDLLNREFNANTGTNRPTYLSATGPFTSGVRGNDLIMTFPKDAADDAGCGTLKLSFSPRGTLTSGGGTTDLTSSFGFRMNAINYAQIRQVAMDAHKATLTRVYQEAVKIVDGAGSLSALDGATSGVSAAQATAVSTLMSFNGLYDQLFFSEVRDIQERANAASNMSAMNDALLEKMRSGGWATLGIWYGVFAEVNEAMNEMLDPTVTFDRRDADLNTKESEMWSSIRALSDLAKTSPISATSAAAGAPTTYSDWTTTSTATGNDSIGQWLIGRAISVAGASGTGSSHTINPIIAFKNIGDNSLALAQTLYIAAKGYQGFKGDSEKKDDSSLLGSVASKATGVFGKLAGGVFRTISQILDDGAALIPYVALALFATATLMAFYLPMLPFIQWFAGLLQWFTSIVESLIGSSLWALAHFDADGEGMGQRASYGYIYMLNNFARPIIMTFAFFIASAAIMVLGTFLFKYFGNAVSSSQGNSLTGLISIIAYLTIFTVMGITLVNGAFGIMLNMADRIIGWIGTNASSAVGHQIEDKINTMFIGASRSLNSSGLTNRLLNAKPTGQPGLVGSMPGGANGMARAAGES